MTGPEIAEWLQMALSTVSGVLARIGLGKLSSPRAARAGKPLRAPASGRADPHRRQEAGQDRRRRRPSDDRQAHGARPRDRLGVVHVCVDDATRLAYVEVLCDERATTAIAFLRRAVDFYRAHGITVERLMTDNGSAYRSIVHALACKTLRIRHIRTRAYRPRTNGKQSASSARCSAPAPTRTEAADRSPAVPEGVATQYRTIEEEVGAEGGDQIKGPWQVSYIVEPAEGWFERRGGELRFREPAEGITSRSSRGRRRPAASCRTSR